ncbi:MAG: queuosine precursor transporter [Candidatus Shapirobacteria bacterium]
MITLFSTSQHKPDFLIAIYIFCIVTAELMGSKTFPLFNLFGLNLTGAVGMFLIPWVFSINDIVTEVYGFARAKNLAKISILIIFFIAIFSAFAVSLPSSSRFLSTNPSYFLVFSQSIRISIASLIAMFISNFLDINIFFKLKSKMGNSKLWFRNNLSNTLALFIDTFIFMTIAFYSTSVTPSANFGFLWGVILPYWFLKTCMSIISTPFVYLGIRWLKIN